MKNRKNTYWNFLFLNYKIPIIIFIGMIIVALVTTETTALIIATLFLITLLILSYLSWKNILR